MFSNHPYTKARFYTKCLISNKVAKFAKQVINGVQYIKDPQDLNVDENICDLQLQLSTDYNGPKVINTRIKKLDVYYDEVDYDPQLLSLFNKSTVNNYCHLPQMLRLLSFVEGRDFNQGLQT
ncbi:hypothetical protein P9112_006086 [Eukaryota sp. TZLM1-RC]